MKQLLLVFLSFFLLSEMNAQVAYLYLEGIRGIPYTIAVNDQTEPMLGKGYSILSFQAEGEKTIYISFANNNFEKQRFIVDIKNGSAYGFKLAKTEENKFYLIDIVNKGKIIETNSNVDLALSTSDNLIYFAVVEDSLTNPKSVAKVDMVSPKESRKERKRKEAEEKLEREKQELLSLPSEKQPTYGVVEVISPEKKKEVVEKETVKEIVKPVTFKKSDCARIASDAEIKSIEDKMSIKSDDDAKLLLIKKRVLSGCYTAKHVYSLAEKFDSQYGRYSLVKFILPLTADINNLQTLDALFKFEAYKSKLRKLIEN